MLQGVVLDRMGWWGRALSAAAVQKWQEFRTGQQARTGQKVRTGQKMVRIEHENRLSEQNYGKNQMTGRMSGQEVRKRCLTVTSTGQDEKE